MLLSIIMMIKNEEHNLIKSLPALNKIRENINSELIILDTGSTDNSIQIAKQFTDKVFYEKWNNNFAEMRNASFKHASGEWLLVLDADEELVDCENLIDFFNSNKCKMYNSASIAHKNFTDEELSNFTYSTLPRMFKRKNFKYKGAIHEQPLYKLPIYNPENGIATFNHYGYIFQDEDFRLKKMKRNENILLSELKKNPKDPYINFQLGVNFSILGELELSKKYLNECINIYSKSGVLYYPCYGTLIDILFAEKKYSQCKETCLRYLKKDNTNLDIHFKLGEIYRIENNFELSIEHYNQYLFYIENPHLSKQVNDISCIVKTIGFKGKAISSLTKIYYNLEQYNEAMKYVTTLQNEKHKELLECLDIYIDCLLRVQKREEIAKLYNILCEDSKTSNFRANAELLLNKMDLDKKKETYEILSNLDDNYGKLNKIRFNNNVDLDIAKTLLKEEKDSCFGDLLYICLNQGIQIETLLTDIPSYIINNFFKYLVSCNKSAVNALYEYLVSRKLSFDINDIKIYCAISEALLSSNKLSTEKQLNVFTIYTNYRYLYTQSIYNNMNDDELLLHLSSKDDYFILKLNKIIKSDELNHLEKSQMLSSLSKEFPNYAKFLAVEMASIKEDFMKNDNIKQLQLEYKNIIKNEVFNQNIETAQTLISQFESIEKNNDHEIECMKGILEMFKSNYAQSHQFLKKSYFMNNNLDTVFNLGHLYNLENNLHHAIKCFKFISMVSTEPALTIDAEAELEHITKLQAKEEF